MAFFSSIIASVTTAFASLTWASVGAFALKTVASMGLSVLAQKLAGKKNTGADFSVKGQLGQGTATPQSLMTGISATAGSLVYANTATVDGWPNVRMYWVIALSDIPVADIEGLYVDGAWQPFTRSHVNGGWFIVDNWSVSDHDGDGDYLTFKFYDGTQTTADADLIAEASTAERPWDASMVGHGRAYAIVRAHLKEGFWTNGFPRFLFTLKGIPLYNPADDSSVGGVGTSRWDDPSTWFPYDNPAVTLYNVLRGIRYNGEWFYGLQDVTAAQLPVAHWIAQINKCSAMIAGGSGSQATFRASGEIPVGNEIFSTIETLLTACNGRLSDAGGTYKLFCGGPDAPVMSFTDDDILSTSEQTFTPFFGLADTVNGVSGKYFSSEAGWQIETAPPIYNPDFEADDGGRRLLIDLNFDFVPHAEQVQRLMKMGLQEARRARRHTLTMPPKFWPLEPGDVITWTSVRNGYESKQFRVDGVLDLAGSDVILDLTEVDPTDYDWAIGDYTAPSGGGDVIVPIPVQQVQGFGVEPASVRDAAYISRMPAIRAFWEAGVPDVRAITMELRVTATGEMIAPATSETPRDGEVFISNGILPDTSYEVRAKFLPITDRPVEWTIWHEVTTYDIKIEPDYISDATWDAIEDQAIGWADKMLRDDPWLAEVTQNALNDLDTLLTSYEGRKLVKQDLATAVQTFETKLIEGELALASVKTALEAQIGANLAAINAEMIVRATADSANASDITTLYSQVVDVHGDLVGVAGAIDSLTTDVTNIDGVLSVQSGQITSLTSRITEAEDVSSGQATAITGLTTNVSSVAGTVSAQAGQISSLSTTVGGQTTTITQHTNSLNGLQGEYVLKINNNGVVTGMSLRSSASAGSEVAFMADRFAITNGPDQAQRKAPFVVYTSPTVVEGTPIAAGVYMRDAFIRDASVTTLRIKGNAVTVPLVSTLGNTITGNGAFQLIHQEYITLDFPGYIFLWWSGTQGYSAGTDLSVGYNHQVKLEINDVFCLQRGGIAITDYVALAYSKYLPAGTHKLAVKWLGQGSLIKVTSRTMMAQAAKR